MTAVVSLLIILSLSFLITRLATAALTLTGVTQDLARLQSVSAFTGVGFTTTESEHIVDHPVRRRILIALMILGNAGVITAVSSLILSFVGLEERADLLWRIAALLVGLAALWVVALSSWIDRRLHAVMRWALSRWTQLRASDYLNLLQLSGDYSVRELDIDEEHWSAETPLGELDLLDEGIMVLGIHRSDGDYVGVPRGETVIHEGDRLVLYGPDDRLGELDDREKGPAGEAAHDQALADQKRRRSDQAQKEAREDRDEPESDPDA